MSVQLADLLADGDIDTIYLGDTNPGSKVLKTSEVDAKVATKLDATPTKIDMLTQVVKPAHLEGRVFFEDEHKCVSVYTDVAGVTHNLGQEHLIRVKNVSGATILNGQACRMAGADPVSFFPQAVLALADTPANAVLLGVATHSIPNNTFGWLTQLGLVHDVDTNGFAVNSVLYLSGTTPGGYDITPPSVITRVGQVLNSGVNGSILILPQSLVSQIKLFGLLKGKAANMNLTTTYQTIDGYTTEQEINLTVDATSGAVVPPNTGTYRATVSMTLTVPSSPSSRDIDIQVWDNTHSVQLGLTTITVSKDATSVSRSVGIPVEADASDNIVLRIKSSVSIAGVVFTFLSFDLESVFVYPNPV